MTSIYNRHHAQVLSMIGMPSRYPISVRAGDRAIGLEAAIGKISADIGKQAIHGAGPKVVGSQRRVRHHNGRDLAQTDRTGEHQLQNTRDNEEYEPFLHAQAHVALCG